MYLQVGDLGYAAELGNYAEYSGAPNEEETLNYARTLIDVRIHKSEEDTLNNACMLTFIGTVRWKGADP